MDPVPFRDHNTHDAPSTYNKTKAKIVGWEYSANGINIVFSPRMPTHSVVWMRPVFEDV